MACLDLASHSAWSPYIRPKGACRQPYSSGIRGEPTYLTGYQVLDEKDFLVETGLLHLIQEAQIQTTTAISSGTASGLSSNGA